MAVPATTPMVRSPARSRSAQRRNRPASCSFDAVWLRRSRRPAGSWTAARPSVVGQKAFPRSCADELTRPSSSSCCRSCMRTTSGCSGQCGCLTRSIAAIGHIRSGSVGSASNALTVASRISRGAGRDLPKLPLPPARCRHRTANEQPSTDIRATPERRRDRRQASRDGGGDGSLPDLAHVRLPANRNVKILPWGKVEGHVVRSFPRSYKCLREFLFSSLEHCCGHGRHLHLWTLQLCAGICSPRSEATCPSAGPRKTLVTLQRVGVSVLECRGIRFAAHTEVREMMQIVAARSCRSRRDRRGYRGCADARTRQPSCTARSLHREKPCAAQGISGTRLPVGRVLPSSSLGPRPDRRASYEHSRDRGSRLGEPMLRRL